MGQAKKMIMDLEENPFSNIPQRMVAIDLFENSYLLCTFLI